MEDVEDAEINWFWLAQFLKRLALDSEDRETSASCKNGCAKRLQNDGCFNDSMSLTIMQTSNKNQPAIKIEFKAQQLPEAFFESVTNFLNRDFIGFPTP